MSVAESSVLPRGFEALAEEALGFAGVQVERLVTTRPGAFPIYTVGGRWHVEEEAWTNWTEGFLGGLIWIIARRTGDAHAARRTTAYMWQTPTRSKEAGGPDSAHWQAAVVIGYLAMSARATRDEVPQISEMMRASAPATADQRLRQFNKHFFRLH